MISNDKQLSFLEFTLNIKRGYDRAKTLSFADGMDLINNFKDESLGDLKVEGLKRPQSARIKLFKHGKVKCVGCGVVGNHWYIERHLRDKKSPHSLNLYALKADGEVMLTWDHILPRSLGGSDNQANAQCMCSTCNSAKGNSLSLNDLLSSARHPNPAAIHHFVGYRPAILLAKTIKDVRAEFVLLAKPHLDAAKREANATPVANAARNKAKKLAAKAKKANVVNQVHLTQLLAIAPAESSLLLRLAKGFYNQLDKVIGHFKYQTTILG